MFAVVVLKHMVEIAQEVYKDADLKEKAKSLAMQINEGIQNTAFITMKSLVIFMPMKPRI